MNRVLGLTGGIGSGKSAAGERFSALGITVVDADQMARVVVEPGKPALDAIAGHFGSEVLQADGSLDRARLRQLVFADPAQRQWLEKLTHPLIGEEIRLRLQRSKSAYSVLASPLLMETNQRGLCDELLLIDVPEELQLARAARRDDNDEAQIRRIMAAQMSRAERRSRADHIIDNSGTLEQLHSAIDALHTQLLVRAALHRQ